MYSFSKKWLLISACSLLGVGITPLLFLVVITCFVRDMVVSDDEPAWMFD